MKHDIVNITLNKLQQNHYVQYNIIRYITPKSYNFCFFFINKKSYIHEYIHTIDRNSQKLIRLI